MMSYLGVHDVDIVPLEHLHHTDTHRDRQALVLTQKTECSCLSASILGACKRLYLAI